MVDLSNLPPLTPGIDQAIDDVEAGKLSAEKGIALGLLEIARGVHKFVDFLGYNDGGRLDIYVQKMVDDK